MPAWEAEHVRHDSISRLPLRLGRGTVHLRVAVEVHQHQPGAPAVLSQEVEVGQAIGQLVERRRPCCARFSADKSNRFAERGLDHTSRSFTGLAGRRQTSSTCALASTRRMSPASEWPSASHCGPRLGQNFSRSGANSAAPMRSAPGPGIRQNDRLVTENATKSNSRHRAWQGSSHPALQAFARANAGSI